MLVNERGVIALPIRIILKLKPSFTHADARRTRQCYRQYLWDCLSKEEKEFILAKRKEEDIRDLENFTSSLFKLFCPFFEIINKKV